MAEQKTPAPAAGPVDASSEEPPRYAVEKEKVSPKTGCTDFNKIHAEALAADKPAPRGETKGD